MTYNEAIKLLGNRSSKKIDNNTHLVYAEKRGAARCDSGVCIVLHSTCVVHLNEDGSKILNSGGWRTATTKDRINRFGGVSLWQRKGEWHVGVGDTTVEYRDGMKVQG